MLTPGMKSSEFLVALLPIVIGIILIALGVWKGEKGLVDTGLYLVMGGSATYGVSRGLAKFGTASPSATPEVAAPADDKQAASIVGKV